MTHYKHVVDRIPDRLSLQNLEQRPIESFNEYAQRWWDLATQVQPSLTEKETIMLFMNTLYTPYPEMLVGGITSFDNLVIVDKMIEGAMKSERIEAEEIRGGTVLKDKEKTQAIFLKSEPNKGYTPYPAYPSYPPCYPEINHAAPTPYIYQLPRPAYPPPQIVNHTFMPQTYQTHRSNIENSDQGSKLKSKNTDWTQFS